MSVLGVFQQLISSKAHDHEGFYLLRILAENIPKWVEISITRDIFSPMLIIIWPFVMFIFSEIFQIHKKSIFIILLQRLSLTKTIKYIKGLAVFLCFYAIHFGVSDLTSLLDSLQNK